MLAWLPWYLQFEIEGGVGREVTGGIQCPLLTSALCWAAGGSWSIWWYLFSNPGAAAQVHAEGGGVRGVSVFPCFQQSPVQEVPVAEGCWH